MEYITTESFHISPFSYLLYADTIFYDVLFGRWILHNDHFYTTDSLWNVSVQQKIVLPYYGM